MSKRHFQRKLASLDLVFDFLNEFFEKTNIDGKCRFSVELAVEEVFSNLIKYNQASLSDISLQVDKTDNQVIIRIMDSEKECFDVSKPPDVDIHAPLAERRIGGLGLFLVHQVMDQVLYHCEDNRSTITLIKNIE